MITCSTQWAMLHSCAFGRQLSCAALRPPKRPSISAPTVRASATRASRLALRMSIGIGALILTSLEELYQIWYDSVHGTLPKSQPGTSLERGGAETALPRLHQPERGSSLARPVA